MPPTTLLLHISHSSSSRPRTDPPFLHISARLCRQQANNVLNLSGTPCSHWQTSPVAPQWPSLKPASLEALAPEAPEARDRKSGFVVQSTTGKVVSTVSIEEGVLDGGKEAIEEKEEGADNGKNKVKEMKQQGGLLEGQKVGTRRFMYGSARPKPVK
ncbi:hypothetical protein JCM11641_001479, partial [Rhodosporidiobolus odoratus]